MFCFVALKCQKCRDLRAFLGVKFGLLILVRVKDLTFSSSAESGCFFAVSSISLTKTAFFYEISTATKQKNVSFFY